MRNEKILIIDDEPSVRRLIWKALQSTGILVYQSDSVEKALDIITRVEFDLFLLDICLEHENDGYHLAQMIREANPFTPIFFLSGKTSEQEIINGLEVGADQYLTKPFSLDLLRAQVVAALDRNKVIRNHHSTAEKKKSLLAIFVLIKIATNFIKMDSLSSFLPRKSN